MTDPITEIFEKILAAQHEREEYNMRMSGIAWIIMACKTVRADIDDEENKEAFTNNMISALLAMGVTPGEIDIVIDALPTIEQRMMGERDDDAND